MFSQINFNNIKQVSYLTDNLLETDQSKLMTLIEQLANRCNDEEAELWLQTCILPEEYPVEKIINFLYGKRIQIIKVQEDVRMYLNEFSKANKKLRIMQDELDQTGKITNFTYIGGPVGERTLELNNKLEKITYVFDTSPTLYRGRDPIFKLQLQHTSFENFIYSELLNYMKGEPLGPVRCDHCQEFIEDLTPQQRAKKFKYHKEARPGEFDSCKVLAKKVRDRKGKQEKVLRSVAKTLEEDASYV